MFLAKLYANSGEKDKAFEQLSKAFEERDSELDIIKVDPLLDPLRSDPRYNELLRRRVRFVRVDREQLERSLETYYPSVRT